MTAARKTTIAQIRANLRRDDFQVIPWASDDKPATDGKQIVSWQVSPKWTNAGATDATEYRGWFDIIPVDHMPGHFWTDADCPSPKPLDPLAAGLVVKSGAGVAQISKSISVGDAALAQANKGYVLIAGHVEYRDIFYPETPLHTDNWCEVFVGTSKFLIKEVVQ